jgi:hypothetical protein
LFFVVCLFLLWWVCLFRWRFGEARRVMVLVDVFRLSSSMGGGLAVASVQGFFGGSFAPASVWWWWFLGFWCCGFSGTGLVVCFWWWWGVEVLMVVRSSDLVSRRGLV